MQDIRAPLLSLLALLASAACSSPRAQPVDYFKGKTVTVYIAFGVGGGYDQYARLFARHVGKHLPGNPTVVPANMVGASGITAANFLYNMAPKDGTALGFLYQTIAQDQVLGMPSIQFDAAKFGWVGRITPTVEIMYTWHTVPVRTAEDLTKRETVLATGGPAVATYANLLKATMGARFKLVRGYPTTQEIHLALQRGEAEAAYSSVSTIQTLWSHWLTAKLINIFMQAMPERHPDLPEVPAVVEFGKSAQDKAVLSFFAAGGTVGRSVVAPPGVPAERLEVLRGAFQETMKDQQFLAEARQMRLDVEPLAGEDLRKINERIVSISPAERERVRAMALMR
jgi:tripartite-type tricarboxylate transporter receptor subunit TctC